MSTHSESSVRKPENTTRRDPFTHVAGMIGSGGVNGYITDMEADGQRQIVASEVLPTDGPWDELEQLGFVPGPVDRSDPLFRQVTLPPGWSRAGTGHSMWSSVLDDRDIERVAVFYKATFYDRSAHCSLVNPGYRAATELVYGRDEPSLPARWDVFTPEERAAFWRSLEETKGEAVRHPEIYGDYLPRIEPVLALRTAKDGAA